MTPRRVAPWSIAAVLCTLGSLGAHAVGSWLQPGGAAVESNHQWLALLPTIIIGGGAALVASLAVETRTLLRRERPDRVPGWIFLALPSTAFLIQEHLERAAGGTTLPLETVAHPAVLTGLALQVPFGLIALAAARLLHRATAAVARRLRRTSAHHRLVRDIWHDATDSSPPKIELLQPAGRGPPAFAVL